MISEKDSKFEENTLLILKVHTTKVITKTILQFFATFSEKLNLHFLREFFEIKTPSEIIQPHCQASESCHNSVEQKKI